MSLKSINKNFKNKGKDIKYLNKDFASYRGNLIEFAKNYFPKTYNDFNKHHSRRCFLKHIMILMKHLLE